MFVFVGGYFYGRNTAVTDIKKGKVLLSYGDDINKMDINKTALHKEATGLLLSNEMECLFKAFHF